MVPLSGRRLPSLEVPIDELNGHPSHSSLLLQSYTLVNRVLLQVEPRQVPRGVSMCFLKAPENNSKKEGNKIGEEMKQAGEIVGGWRTEGLLEK